MLGPSTIAVFTDVMCRQFSFLLRPLRTEKKSDLLVPSWKNMVRRWEFGVLSIVWHSIVCWLEYVRILIFTYIFIYLLHVFNSNCSSPWKIHFNRVYCLPNQYNINITRTHTYIYIHIYVCEYIFPIVILDVVSPWDQSHQFGKVRPFATQVPPSIHATMEECRMWR